MEKKEVSKTRAAACGKKMGILSVSLFSIRIKQNPSDGPLVDAAMTLVGNSDTTRTIASISVITFVVRFVLFFI